MDHTKPETVLPHFRKWLFKISQSYYPYDVQSQNDLAQEGYIAMWKSLSKFDPDKVADYQAALVAWVTKAAKMRMSDVVRRQTWTGTPMRRGHTREDPGIPLDALSGGAELDADENQWINKLLGSSHLSESVYLAYHYGEIYAALNALSEDDRELVYSLFWLGSTTREIGSSLGINEATVRFRWNKIKLKLEEPLKHLATAV